MGTGTTTIEGHEFENEDVVIDFIVFNQCRFTKCNLIFHGYGPVNLANNNFTDCTWSFSGPANSTVNFLRAMYNGGSESGRLLVETTLQMIRTPMK